MASNKVIINSEANSVVISEPVEGNRIVKVIAAGPQGARGEGFNSVSSSLNERIDVLEAFSGSYTGSFSGSFVAVFVHRTDDDLMIFTCFQHATPQISFRHKHTYVIFVG